MRPQLRVVVAAATVVLASGCLHPLPNVASSATVKQSDLPSDTPGLIKYVDEQLEKGDRISAENALAAVDKGLSNTPREYELLWRGAKICVALATDAGRDNVRKESFSGRGMDYGKKAVAVLPTRVEGHYFLGISLGLYATTKTFGRSLVPKIRDAGLDAVKIDERYEHGGPLRLLGSVYVKAPPWPASIGDVEEGEKYLERAVKIDGDYPLNHLLYADALASDHQKAEATREYNAVLAALPQPVYARELDGWKKSAQKGIDRITHKQNQAEPPAEATNPSGAPSVGF